MPYEIVLIVPGGFLTLDWVRSLFDGVLKDNRVFCSSVGVAHADYVDCKVSHRT